MTFSSARGQTVCWGGVFFSPLSPDLLYGWYACGGEKKRMEQKVQIFPACLLKYHCNSTQSKIDIQEVILYFKTLEREDLIKPFCFWYMYIISSLCNSKWQENTAVTPYCCLLLVFEVWQKCKQECAMWTCSSTFSNRVQSSGLLSFLELYDRKHPQPPKKAPVVGVLPGLTHDVLICFGKNWFVWLFWGENLLISFLKNQELASLA